MLSKHITISDAELVGLNSGLGNFNGSSINLSRSPIADVNDVFTAINNVAFTNGDLLVDGTIIGSVTNVDGILDITFNNNATASNVNTALRNVAYTLTSTTDGSGFNLVWNFTDGNTGSQGTGGALSAISTIAVSIAAGWIVNYFCSGVNKMAVVTDGAGATYLATIENDSLDCGFVPP